MTSFVFFSRLASKCFSRRCEEFSLRLFGQRRYTQTSADIWKPELYERDASFVYEKTTNLFRLLQPKQGQRILDLGCGTGELSIALERFGCEVVGVDVSPAMVAVAKQKGVNAILLDGHEMAFENEFDAVISNYALHWMIQNPKQVLFNVGRGLRKGGIFAGKFSGKGSVDSILQPLELVLARRSMPFQKLLPWFQPSRWEYWTLLQSAGFQVMHMSLRDWDVAVSYSPSQWLEIFGGNFFHHVSESEKRQIYDEVELAMQPIRVNEKGEFVIDYMELLFAARSKK